MVQVENRALGVAVAGSVVAHVVVFLLVALYAAFPIFAWELPKKPDQPPREEVEKMTIILPEAAAETPPTQPEVTPDEDGFVPAPEIPLPDPEEKKPDPIGYIRTTQNDAESSPPDRTDFVSDRDTTGASELPADPEGTAPVPTQDGREDLPGIELKDRDYRDGEIKDDEATPTPEASASRPTPPVNPNPLLEDPQPPEEPADPGERNEATDPDAKGPDLENPPPVPGESEGIEGVGETEAPSISIEPDEMSKDPVEEEAPPNPLEIEVAPEAVEKSIPPPANFENILGGEDLFPLPRREEEPPTPDSIERIDPTVLPPPPPSESPAPLPKIRRPEEVIMPAVPVLPIPPSPLSVPSVPLPGDPTANTPDAFQPHTRKQKMSGTLSNRAPASVNAEATALGRYTRQVTGNIERRWHILRSQKADFITFGNMRIRFDVNAQGRTQNVRILSNDSNPIMADFTLSAIIGAKSDPMPPEVVRELALADGLLEITYNVIIY